MHELIQQPRRSTESEVGNPLAPRAPTFGAAQAPNFGACVSASPILAKHCRLPFHTVTRPRLPFRLRLPFRPRSFTKTGLKPRHGMAASTICRYLDDWSRSTPALRSFGKRDADARKSKSTSMQQKDIPDLKRIKQPSKDLSSTRLVGGRGWLQRDVHGLRVRDLTATPLPRRQQCTSFTVRCTKHPVTCQPRDEMWFTLSPTVNKNASHNSPDQKHIYISDCSARPTIHIHELEASLSSDSSNSFWLRSLVDRDLSTEANHLRLKSTQVRTFETRSRKATTCQTLRDTCECRLARRFPGRMIVHVAARMSAELGVRKESRHRDQVAGQVDHAKIIRELLYLISPAIGTIHADEGRSTIPRRSKLRKARSRDSVLPATLSRVWASIKIQKEKPRCRQRRVLAGLQLREQRVKMDGTPSSTSSSGAAITAAHVYKLTSTSSSSHVGPVAVMAMAQDKAEKADAEKQAASISGIMPFDAHDPCFTLAEAASASISSGIPNPSPAIIICTCLFYYVVCWCLATSSAHQRRNQQQKRLGQASLVRLAESSKYGSIPTQCGSAHAQLTISTKDHDTKGIPKGSSRSQTRNGLRSTPRGRARKAEIQMCCDSPLGLNHVLFCQPSFSKMKCHRARSRYQAGLRLLHASYLRPHDLFEVDMTGSVSYLFEPILCHIVASPLHTTMANLSHNVQAAATAISATLGLIATVRLRLALNKSNQSGRLTMAHEIPIQKPDNTKPACPVPDVERNCCKPPYVDVSDH
ncbi:uncharacterized protein MYCFIDRAFT_180408 [Pseudocercospora fijiensis CIRAD86]|uniref:Uncharacterized protein n=1 Tax=Pseudocercospora fijiensis (strain CIRAD86) TaxID=383855 RepID=M2YGY1_PSEFD|nr:uncharacterized protein MYCFIDRAFT_180408 [Pseudocercospora fijiensis CIRAD86]EME77075.1 hypothetical protein MYCFIDRAFT_180408 [Pseudocercospora fijiensis CIRAD86]